MKVKRYIYISAIEKHVSLKVYILAIKKAKNNLNETFKHGLTTWYPCKGYDIIKQFQSGIHERINENISYSKRGII